MHPQLISKPRRRTGGVDPDNELTHPLLGDEPTLQLMPNPDDVRSHSGKPLYCMLRHHCKLDNVFRNDTYRPHVFLLLVSAEHLQSWQCFVCL